VLAEPREQQAQPAAGERHQVRGQEMNAAKEQPEAGQERSERLHRGEFNAPCWAPAPSAMP